MFSAVLRTCAHACAGVRVRGRAFGRQAGLCGLACAVCTRLKGSAWVHVAARVRARVAVRAFCVLCSARDDWWATESSSLHVRVCVLQCVVVCPEIYVSDCTCWCVVASARASMLAFPGAFSGFGSHAQSRVGLCFVRVSVFACLRARVWASRCELPAARGPCVCLCVGVCGFGVRVWVRVCVCCVCVVCVWVTYVVWCMVCLCGVVCVRCM